MYQLNINYRQFTLFVFQRDYGLMRDIFLCRFILKP